MNVPFTYVSELALDATDKDKMWVTVGVEKVDATDHCIEFAVSLSYMGLNWDSEFEMEFSKDIQRDMNQFYGQYHREPTASEYKKLTERHLYR